VGIPENLKPIILCADDYGVSPSVGAGIRELVAARRLSAVSCLSTAPTWPEEAVLLKPLRAQIDVGLHFNLTLGFGHSAPSLMRWIGCSLTGHIGHAAVERELKQQLDRFESAWGEPPDFIDGHQHVHIFPGIRDHLFRLLADRYPAGRRPWIRRVNPVLTGHDAPIKALVLKLLSCGFSKNARQAGLALNSGFAGLYSLSEKADFPTMMSGWLRWAQPGTLLMCHPGICSEPDPEGIGPTREREFHYLRGKEFGEALNREGIVLVRFDSSPEPVR